MSKRRAIAYSLDLLIPGLYVWCGQVVMRLGGVAPDDSPYRYPGTLKSWAGCAIVFPNGFVLTTDQQRFDGDANDN